jgi:hypothetical protein
LLRQESFAPPPVPSSFPLASLHYSAFPGRVKTFIPCQVCRGPLRLVRFAYN